MQIINKLASVTQIAHHKVQIRCQSWNISWPAITRNNLHFSRRRRNPTRFQTNSHQIIRVNFSTWKVKQNRANFVWKKKKMNVPFDWIYSASNSIHGKSDWKASTTLSIFSFKAPKKRKCVERRPLLIWKRSNGERRRLSSFGRRLCDDRSTGWRGTETYLLLISQLCVCPLAATPSSIF